MYHPVALLYDQVVLPQSGNRQLTDFDHIPLEALYLVGQLLYLGVCITARPVIGRLPPQLPDHFQPLVLLFRGRQQLGHRFDAGHYRFTFQAVGKCACFRRRISNHKTGERVQLKGVHDLAVGNDGGHLLGFQIHQIGFEGHPRNRRIAEAEGQQHCGNNDHYPSSRQAAGRLREKGILEPAPAVECICSGFSPAEQQQQARQQEKHGGKTGQDPQTCGQTELSERFRSGKGHYKESRRSSDCGQQGSHPGAAISLAESLFGLQPFGPETAVVA